MVRDDRELAASRKEARQRKKIKKLLNFDYTLLLIVIFILAFGLVMLYSTSAYAASLKRGNSIFYLRKQAMAAGLGFVGMFFSTKIDYRRWGALVWPIYMFSVFLCVLVIFAGVTINESSRWLNIAGVQFQPSEIAKVAVILLVAILFVTKVKIYKPKGPAYAFFGLLAIVLLTVYLVVL